MLRPAARQARLDVRKGALQMRATHNGIASTGKVRPDSFWPAWWGWLLWAPLLSLACYCSDFRDPSGMCTEQCVPGEPVTSRFLTRLPVDETAAVHYVIRSEQAYWDLLAELDPTLDPPQVDFDREMVLAVATTGVEHFYIHDLGARLGVFLCVDQITIAIYAPTLHFVAVARDDRPVVFNRMGVPVPHEEL